MKFDVLVVEDEASLLRGILRGLSADKRLNTLGVQSVEEALEVLDNDPPDLLLTDIRLPDRSGLDLILELQQRAIRIPIVVMTAHRTAYEGEISSHTGLTVLEKPVPLAQLRAVVRDRLEATRGKVGETGPFKLVDYLQLASLGHHSMVFEIEIEEGRAKLEVVNGDLWNAYLGGMSGEQAVATLLEAEILTLSYRSLDGSPGRRQFHGGVEALLLNIARKRDEEGRGESKQEADLALDAVFEGAYSPPDGLDAGREGPRDATVAADGRTQERLDEGSNSICQQLVESTRGALSCLVFDSVSSCVIGAYGWANEDPPGADNRHLLAILLAENEGGGPSFLGAPTEILATGRSGLRFLKREDRHGLITVLATDPTVKPGMGWMALRDLEPLSGKNTCGILQTLPELPELIWDEDRWEDPLVAMAQTLSLATEEGRLAFVVDSAAGRVKASSLSKSRSLAELSAQQLRSTLHAFLAPDAGRAEPLFDEILVSSPRAHLFLKLLPGSSLVAGLLAGRATRPGLGWIAIREGVEGN